MSISKVNRYYHPRFFMKKEEVIELSFVLPCLNEEKTIERCVRQCWEVLQSNEVQGEVIVSDNGSDDNSVKIARSAGAYVVDVRGKGYGSACRGGIRAASGKFILIGDSDLSYDFSQMPRFLRELRGGADLVVGCRLPAGGGRIDKGAMPFLHRWVGNPVLSFLGRIFFKADVKDFHCGIRAFDRQKIQRLRLRAQGMEFATEMIVKAVVRKLNIVQVPVALSRDGRGGNSHLKTWSDGWRHLRFLLLHSPRWLFVYPGTFITMISLPFFIGLINKPFIIGHIHFEKNTMLAAAVGILCGSQIVFLGFFIEVFSRRFGLRSGLEVKSRRYESIWALAGLFLGCALFLAGFFCLLYALTRWKHLQFGDLPDAFSRQFGIPAVVSMALGLQIIFGCFALAVLRLDDTTTGAEEYSN
jgi:glycosyltransferase involved in cell wall biosynthesis